MLYGLPKSTLHRLQKIQNNAARIITKTKRYDHITPALNQLHWLPVKERIDYKILTVVHKSIYGLAPKYLQDMINIYHPARALRSEHQLLLQASPTNTTYGDRTFPTASAKLWNNLPFELRSTKELKSFQKQLKYRLFNN